MNVRSFAAAAALLLSPLSLLALSSNQSRPWTSRDIAQVTGRPFAATRTTKEVLTGADGSSVTREFSSKVVRDANGRVRTETPIVHQPDGKADPSNVAVQVYDPVGRTILSWTTQGKVATLIHLPPQTAAVSATGSSNEVESLGSQSVNNLNAKGERVMQVMPAGAGGYKESATVVTETWTASDLQVPVRQVINDPRRGTITTELSGISQSVPDASLFQAPAGYTVQDLTPKTKAAAGAQ
jgi:hypothetical protein